MDEEKAGLDDSTITLRVVVSVEHRRGEDWPAMQSVP